MAPVDTRNRLKRSGLGHLGGSKKISCRDEISGMTADLRDRIGPAPVQILALAWDLEVARTPIHQRARAKGLALEPGLSPGRPAGRSGSDPQDPAIGFLPLLKHIALMFKAGGQPQELPMTLPADPAASQLDGSAEPPFNLPLRVPVRWVAKRKAEVIAAVRLGHITLADACARYRLSAEEFRQWERDFDGHGLGGLRATVRGNRKNPVSPGASEEITPDAADTRNDCIDRNSTTY
jgi:hypothetical protein